MLFTQKFYQGGYRPSEEERMITILLVTKKLSCVHQRIFIFRSFDREPCWHWVEFVRLRSLSLYPPTHIL